MQLTAGLGVSAGRRHRPRRGAEAGAGDLGFGIPPAASPARSSGCTPRATRRASRSADQGAHRQQRRRGARLSLRRAAADARRPRCWSSAPPRSSARAPQRGVGAAARARRDLRLLRPRRRPYLRERKGDVADVVGRLCGTCGRPAIRPTLFKHLEGPLVLVADEMTPSLIAQLDWHRLAALVTDAGSWTYHSAILARSIRVPAVAGLRNASAIIAPGVTRRGRRFHRRGVRRSRRGHRAADPAARRQQRRPTSSRSTNSARCPASPPTASHIRLEANIESPDDAHARDGTWGGGDRPVPLRVPAGRRRPGGATEEAQYAAYRRLVASAARRAGDDPHVRRQRNPAADRARRHRRHARAARTARHAAEPRARGNFRRRSSARCLRAAVHGPLRIMFPFVIGCGGAARRARGSWRGAPRAARARGAGAAGPDRRHDRSAFRGTDRRPAGVGSRLLQHRHERLDPVRAGGRSHRRPRVAPLRALHPAILRLLRGVARAGRQRGIRVAVCGEMAADPVLLALLVGPRAA